MPAAELNPTRELSVSPFAPVARVLVCDPMSRAGLAALLECTEIDVKTGLTEAELCEIIGGYDAVLVRSQTRITAPVIAAGKRLQVIARAGVGVDTIDVAAASAAGIVVVNAPDGNTIAAAEHTLGLLFAIARHIPAADASVKRDEWNRTKFLGTELAGKTLGVIGLGRIGTRVAMVASALGMHVVAHDPCASPLNAEAIGVPLLALNELANVADFVTVHVPKTADTTHMIDAAFLTACKHGVGIINCARGGVVDEAALIAALQSGQVGRAALDVFEAEPVVSDDLKALGDRVVLTPHLGASTFEAQEKVASNVARQVQRVLGGLPVSEGMVNRPRPADARAMAYSGITQAD